MRDDQFGYDVRNCNISGEDLSVVKDMNDLNFDTNTIWPKNYQMTSTLRKFLSIIKIPAWVH